MKVRQEILNKITGALRAQIAAKLGTSDQNIYLAIKRNVPNGRLTKMDFLQAASEVLDVSIVEILEEEAIQQD